MALLSGSAEGDLLLTTRALGLGWGVAVRHVWNEREILSKFAEEQPPFPFANRLLGTFKDETTVKMAV